MSANYDLIYAHYVANGFVGTLQDMEKQMYLLGGPVVYHYDAGGVIDGFIGQGGAVLPLGGIPTQLSVTATNRSTTITTLNTSQVLMPANTTRAGIKFQNNSAFMMGINLSGGVAAVGGQSLYTANTAASVATLISATGIGVGSIFIQPWQTWKSADNLVSNSVITIACGRSSSPFSCTEYTANSGQSFAKTPTDRSGTIAALLYAQQVFPINASRKGWLFQNLSHTSMRLQEIVSPGLTGVEYIVRPYEIVTNEAFGSTTSAISVLARTGGIAFTALEF